MTTMQSITQSAVQERLVMEEELKKALPSTKVLYDLNCTLAIFVAMQRV